MVDRYVHPGFSDSVDLGGQILKFLLKLRVLGVAKPQRQRYVRGAKGDQVYAVKTGDRLDFVETSQLVFPRSN